MRERQNRRPEAAHRLARGNGLARLSLFERRLTRGVLRGMRQRLEQGKEDRRREKERQKTGDERTREHAPRARSAVTGEKLPEEIDAARREAVKEGLRMPAVEREDQRDGGDADRSAPALPREAPEPEQEERKGRDRRSDRPAVPEEHVS